MPGKCSYLRDYSTLVGEVKDGLAEGLSLRNAIIRAVKFCFANGIMDDYHSEEFFDMLALEWNLDDAKQAWFEDGVERGMEQGIETIALNMLRMGMTVDKIHEATKLSPERIKKLAEDRGKKPMNFLDLDLKPEYRSFRDDVIKEFFCPVLKVRFLRFSL